MIIFVLLFAKIMESLIETLKKFDPISLEGMDNVKLLNRTDTKYMMPREKLEEVLNRLAPHYQVLDILGKRTNDYKTQYFDTKDFDFYSDHQRGKLNRKKIRYRKYLDSNLCYLEIKFKTNKDKTDKKRIKCADFELIFSEKSKNFIEGKTFIPVDSIHPKLVNFFTRITLVHKRLKERATIDLNLHYSNESDQKSLQNLVIAELKQEKFSAQSDFVKVMKEMKIYRSGFSKYCIGATLLYKHLKNNSFKPKLIRLNKLHHGKLAS